MIFKKLEDCENEKQILQLYGQLLRKKFVINLTYYGSKVCQSLNDLVILKRKIIGTTYYLC